MNPGEAMGAIEDTRKVLQDFLAPELREIRTRLDSLEKRMDERFEESEKRAAERHNAVMLAITSLANYNELRERLTRLEAKQPVHQ
jgi:tetrahydromethanopterin S-methyltransferase subunit G